MSQTAGRNRFLIIAILTPRSDSVEIFREYETSAAVVIARHGGSIERTIVEEPSGTDKPIREAHVVSFPNFEAFQSYRTDPDLAALSGMRLASIAHTELLFGREGPDYMALSDKALRPGRRVRPRSRPRGPR
jgi:uncharacterized protein (DUF1330 family)